MKRNYMVLPLFSFLLMSVPISSYARHHKPNIVENVVKVGCIGGAVAAGGYALYKFGSWLFNTSTEQVINNARLSYQQAHNCAGELLELIERYRNFDMRQKIWPQKTLDDEAFLYQIADMRYGKESINAYLYILERSIHSLETNSSQARKRARELRRELFDNPTLRDPIYKLDEIASKIDNVLPHIEFLHTHLAKHKSYFALYEIEAHMLNYYSKELDAAYYHSDDQYYVEKQLNQALLSYYPHERYPYVCYAQVLGTDVQKLSRALSQAHGYKNRSESARTLQMHANWLYELVIASKEYRFELKQREQERREKERLALEKRKAEAREREVRAIERKNRLKERELYDRECDLEHREYCCIHECAECTYADCMTFSIHL